MYACGIHDKYKQQILKINETWGNTDKVKILYFFGEEKSEEFTSDNYIYLENVKDDYLSASYKQYLGLKYVYENYKTKFIFCCGTDTFINIPKLLNFIQQFNYNEDLYIGGHRDYRKIYDKDIYFHSGGPGFIITPSCLEKLDLNNIMNDWETVCNENNFQFMLSAADVSIAYFLQKNNVKIHKSNNFHHCNYLGHPCCINTIDTKNIISCHNMRLEDFDNFNHLLQEDTSVN